MLNYLITQLDIVIKGYGVIGVLLSAFLEEIIAPIPSSLVAMLAGFFLIPSDYPLVEAIVKVFLEIAIPMSIGMTVGSLVFYMIAYFGGKPIILKYGNWVKINWQLVEKTEEKFSRGYNDEIILFILRSLPIVPSVAISAFCGLIRYPVKKFIIISLLGNIVRSTIMSVIGWQVRDAYTLYYKIFTNIENFIFILAFVGFITFLVIRFKNKKQKQL